MTSWNWSSWEKLFFVFWLKILLEIVFPVVSNSALDQVDGLATTHEPMLPKIPDTI